MNYIFNVKKNEIISIDINYVNINEGKILKNKNNCLIIDEYCLLKYIFKYKYELFEKIDSVFIDLNFEDNPYTHLYFFLGKTIYYNYNKNNDDNILKNIMTNPTISGLYNIDINYKFKKYEIKYQNDIENEICHIDISNILRVNNNIYDFDFILKKFNLVKGHFLIYNIYNLPESLLENNNSIVDFYKNLMQNIGKLCITHPVNDKTTNFSYSRDIKFIQNTKRFYSSNIRQPLHNDFAYYPYHLSPDWFILMSLQECNFGGITSLITVKLLRTILEEYNENLLKELESCVVTYKYEDIQVKSIVHEKKILTKDNIINWNYFQIKDKLNSKQVIDTRDRFFRFLNKIISEGEISTLKKKWKRGDAIIINDHFLLHERSSFLGNRWLKDMTVKDNNLRLNRK